MFEIKKNFGLVLGGGGARGFFHMGVIKGLQEMGIKISEISGTSIGAVIGLMYAANPKIDFEEITNQLDFFKITQLIVLQTNKKPNGVLEKFLKNYIKADYFEELKIKMRFNATDINANKEIIFEKGRIFPAIMASIAIPGVFYPLKYHDKYLVDGGVVNNVPISLIKKTKKIIVSNITLPIKEITEKTSMITVLKATVIAMQQSSSLEKTKQLKRKKIVYLNSVENNSFVLDFRKKNYQSLIDLGYKSIMERRTDLQPIKNNKETIFKK